MITKGKILAASVRRGGFEVCEALEDINFMKTHIKVKIYKPAGKNNTYVKLGACIQEIEVENILEEIEVCDKNRFQVTIPDSQLAKITLAINKRFNETNKKIDTNSPPKCGSKNFSLSSTVIENLVLGTKPDDEFSSISETSGFALPIFYDSGEVDRENISPQDQSAVTDLCPRNLDLFVSPSAAQCEIAEPPKFNFPIYASDWAAVNNLITEAESTQHLSTQLSGEYIEQEISKAGIINRTGLEHELDQDGTLNQLPCTQAPQEDMEHEEIVTTVSSNKMPEQYSDQTQTNENEVYILETDGTLNEFHCTQILEEGVEQGVILRTVSSNQVPEQNITEEPEELYFSTAKKKGPLQNKRVYDKRHVCFYCHQRKSKMTRHLISNHSNELNVSKCMSMPDNSEVRKNEFLKLLRMGDFFHNCEVLEKEEGELILVRRPSQSEAKCLTPKDYGPCPDCSGFMVKKHLWHHSKTCFLSSRKNTDENQHQAKNNILQQSRALIATMLTPLEEESFKENIIDKLLNDERGTVARNDELIKQFGIVQFEKHSNQQFELIRQTMRQCARLLIELRNVTENPSSTLADFIHPNQFDNIITAVRNLCMTNDNTSSLGIPSLALKIGFHLQKCAGIMRGRFLRTGLVDSDSSTKKFLELYNLEWTDRVSAKALNTLRTNKMNVADGLPLTNDLMELNKYIKLKLEELQNKLSMNQNDREAWLELSKTVLCRIILFNKKRSGEASKMKTKDFQTVEWSSESSDELKQSLTKLEIHLSQSMSLIQIKGKRGRIVPVLITPDIKNSMDLLQETRSGVGVDPNNEFFFARPNFGALTHIRGSDCLREIVGKAQLKEPRLVTSTKLRKYVATVSQVFNMDERQVDWLARHLGHDLSVHRNFYRLHDSALELTQVSKILLAADKGIVHKLKGRNIDDLGLEDLLEDNEPEEMDEDDENADDIGGNISSDIDSNNRGNFDDQESEDGEIDNDNDSNYEPTAKRKKIIKRPTVMETVKSERMVWSDEKKQKALTFFRDDIKNSRVPGIKRCKHFLDENSTVVGNVHWKKIKQFVDNQIKKIKKLKNVHKKGASKN